MTILNRCFW